MNTLALAVKRQNERFMCQSDDALDGMFVPFAAASSLGSKPRHLAGLPGMCA
jgi:hypothetical protein